MILFIVEWWTRCTRCVKYTVRTK